MLEGSNIPLPANPTVAELARELLLYRMQEYSEAMCASWLSDAEFDVWELGEPGKPNPLESAWLRQNGLDCRKLGEIASGWWVYDARPQAEESGWTGANPHFISLTEWKERLVTWREARLNLFRERAKGAAEHGMEPEAAARWAQVPAMDQAALLDRVWCDHCRRLQPLAVSGGHPAFIGGGLWLTGTCPGCGGLLQTEYPGRTPLKPQF